MTTDLSFRVIARIRSDFPAKFGIPRQSGLVEELKARVVLEPEFRQAEALRGLEEFSHIWLLWQFSATMEAGWSPTVRPPRLGGNARLGVFATRSPFRPNPIGLSCVRLEGIEPSTPEGPVLHVAGADLMDNTPIYDIKPYLPYTDCRPEAYGGFTANLPERRLRVKFSPDLANAVPYELRRTLEAVLSLDPRPAYQESPERVYKLDFAGLAIAFTVDEDMLRVVALEPRDK